MTAGKWLLQRRRALEAYAAMERRAAETVFRSRQCCLLSRKLLNRQTAK